MGKSKGQFKKKVKSHFKCRGKILFKWLDLLAIKQYGVFFDRSRKSNWKDKQFNSWHRVQFFSNDASARWNLKAFGQEASLCQDQWSDRHNDKLDSTFVMLLIHIHYSQFHFSCDVLVNKKHSILSISCCLPEIEQRDSSTFWTWIGKKYNSHLVIYMVLVKRNLNNNNASDTFQFTYAKYYGFLKDLDGDPSDQPCRM